MGDIVADNSTGLLFERGDVAGLTRALRELARNPELRQQMGEQARRRATELLDWSLPAARLVSLYQQCLEAPWTESTHSIGSHEPVAAP
jgi:glycosyltransferase involved in cell wall biosynthesis